MTTGYCAFVLHAHLPFVRHPERDDCLEERWLFEANTECYLPLLETLEGLRNEGIPFRLTVSLSPTLLAMLDDPLLRKRYRRHLAALVQLADREVELTKGWPEHNVARWYQHHLHAIYKLYTERFHQDIVAGFHSLAKDGYLELITCGATHGFLPLMQHQPEAVRAQIQVACEEFRRRWGHPPRGFWLPECGYFPGVDKFLKEAGVQYCIVEHHGLAHARPAAKRGVFSHAWTPSGIAVFGRDVGSSKQVWSADEGYPGDPSYREFYRDVGWDRDPQHLGRLAAPNGVRAFTGLKYHKVTGPTDSKDLYDRWAAEQTAMRHARHFVHERARQVAVIQGILTDGPPPVIVSPYDAELFGHWWFEGPYFIGQVARAAAEHPGLEFITPGDYISRHDEGQGVLEPSYSSWGYQGYADFWLDGANHWMYRHMHGVADRMVDLARRNPNPTETVRRALNQAARELLLAQSSDWAFILKTGTATDYVWQRFHNHAGRFAAIDDALNNGEELNPRWLAQVEAADNVFPTIDYRVYTPS